MYIFTRKKFISKHKKRFKEKKQEQVRREKEIVFGALLNTDIFPLKITGQHYINTFNYKNFLVQLTLVVCIFEFDSTLTYI